MLIICSCKCYLNISVSVIVYIMMQMIILRICYDIGCLKIGVNRCVLQLSDVKNISDLVMVFVLNIYLCFGYCVDSDLISMMVLIQMWGFNYVKVKSVSMICCRFCLLLLVVIIVLFLCYVDINDCVLYYVRKVMLFQCKVLIIYGNVVVSVFIFVILVVIRIVLDSVQIVIIMNICCCSRFCFRIKVFCVLMVRISVMLVCRLIRYFMLFVYCLY